MMGECNRLLSKVVKIFPTAEIEKVRKDLNLCRKQDKAGTTDWEDGRARFKRVLLIAFKERHKHKGNK